MNRIFYLLIISLFLFSACDELAKKLGSPGDVSTEDAADEKGRGLYVDEEDEENPEYKTDKRVGFHEELYPETKNEKNENRDYKKLKVDEYNNNIAKFIAGIKTKAFAELQKKDFYDRHKSAVSQAWEKTEGEDLEPIIQWTRENMIAGNPDFKTTVFYPFSGPDILYGNAFFPYARNYVLVGLERPGSLPHIEGLSNEQLNTYLTNIRSSQRYISKHGYFITKHMLKDFAKSNLDGTIHLMLFYLARTRHEILGISEVAINNYGEETESKYGNIRGIRIDFAKQDLKYKQSVYYFKFDLSNDHVAENQGLLRFLRNQFKMYTYMKSASYILHDSHFSTVRDFVTENSSKLLQDDTGVPYYKLKESNLELTLFGKYTSTIKDFKNHFQPDLKKALDEQENSYKLPFIVGYSSWLGETLLMYGENPDIAKEEKLVAKNYKTETKKETVKKRQTKTKTETKTTRKLSYRVQFLYSSRFYKQGSSAFKGLKNVGYYKVDGAYKYTLGDEKSSKDCILLRKKARDAGFKDAFIIALFNGKRISLRQAEKISN